MDWVKMIQRSRTRSPCLCNPVQEDPCLLPKKQQDPVMKRAVAPPGSGSDRAGGSAGITTESSPQVVRKFTAQCIRVIDNTMGHLRTTEPELDLQPFRELRLYLENSRDGISAQNLAKLQTLMRNMLRDPKKTLHSLLVNGRQKQRHRQAQRPGQGSHRQETFAQIRVPMGAHGQRIRGGLQPGMATGSKPKRCLSQGRGRPTAIHERRQRTPNNRQMQTDGRRRLPWMSPDEEAHGQQPQLQRQPAYQLVRRPLAEFTAAMDKIAEAFIQLEKEYGTEKFNKARCEISDETYALRRSIGCTLPRDIVRPPTGLDPSSSSSTSENRKRVSDDNSKSGSPTGLAQCTKDGMDADEPAKAELEKAELPNEYKLFSGDKSPASKDFTLDDVNPKLREEVKRAIERLHEVTFTLVHPGEDEGVPNMAEMETHVTCLDLNEWNNSIIFKLVFDHRTLPWDLPPLFIRIPPNYLVEQRVNWYTRMDEFNNPNIPNDGKINIYTRDEIHTFLNLCSTQVSRYMDNLRTVSAAERLGVKINFSYIAEVWTKSLYLGLEQFMAS